MTIEEIKKAIKGTMFEQDLGVALQINNADSSRGFWNLVVSIRDCKLAKVGMKPHRNWKITDVKKYFGIKGDAAKMVETLEIYRDTIFPKKEETPKA